MAHEILRPGIYDLVQALAGLSRFRAHLAGEIAARDSDSPVLDLGGGTGLYRSLWSSDATFVCLDPDMANLRRARERTPRMQILQASGENLPFSSGFFECVLIASVAHHLSTSLFTSVLAECSRVLKPRGRLIFVDPVWDPGRWRGRALWWLDRGEYPRTPDALKQALQGSFELEHWETFVIQHRYALAVGRPKSAGVVY